MIITAVPAEIPKPPGEIISTGDPPGDFWWWETPPKTTDLGLIPNWDQLPLGKDN